MRQRRGGSVNLAAAQWVSDHPEIWHSEEASSNPLPVYLSVAKAWRLITFLSSARLRPGVTGRARDGQMALTWQAVCYRWRWRCSWAPGCRRAMRSLSLVPPTVAGGQVRGRP